MQTGQLLVISVCAAMAAVAPVRGLHAQPASHIADVMGQSVCTGQAGAVPGDAACGTLRKLAPGELPGYMLTNFQPGATPCPKSQGAVSLVSLPIVQNGIERVAALRRHNTAQGCAGHAADPVLASVQWHDETYGFIMASGSPAAVSVLESPPACAAAPSSSRRFSRGWVIGPAVLPPAGGTGYVSLAEVTGALNPATLYGPCPKGIHYGLTTWVRDRTSYSSGHSFDSLVSEHWSRADAAGSTPGLAANMERTYWTAEFGLTRWEKWALVDGQPAASVVAAAASVAKQTGCSAPHPVPASPTPSMQGSPGASAETFVLSYGGAQHNWALIHCADFTNLVRKAPPPALTAVPAEYDGLWQP